MNPQKILIRAIINMIGTPKEHLDKIIREYVQELKKEDGVKIIKEDYAEAEEKSGKKGMFSTFVELEIEFKDVDRLMWFSFDYMPSSIEIIEPEIIEQTCQGFTAYLNELQTKLHKLDMLIKNFEAENKVLKKNGMTLLKNIIVITLKQNPRTCEELAKEAGVPSDHIKRYLDALVKEGKVIEKDGNYSLNK
jgi:predicted transcriptional regulator